MGYQKILEDNCTLARGLQRRIVHFGHMFLGKDLCISDVCMLGLGYNPGSTHTQADNRYMDLREILGDTCIPHCRIEYLNRMGMDCRDQISQVQLEKIMVLKWIWKFEKKKKVIDI